METPSCFLASRLVRTRQKIQSATWARVVQIFWPLTTHSPSTSSARVVSEARSEPASGSENPWHHQSSSDRMRGMKWAFCSSVPNFISTGASIPMPNTGAFGAPSSASTSSNRWRCTTVQPGPPYSTGHDGAPQPLAISACCQRVRSSRFGSLPFSTMARVSGSSVAPAKARTSSAKARSAGS